MTSLSKISSAGEFASNLRTADDFDLLLTIATISSAQSELLHLQKLNQDLLFMARREQADRKYYYSNKERKRRRAELNDLFGGDDGDVDGWSRSSSPTWQQLRDSISDRLFKKKYRMSKLQFGLLCTRIKEKVGDAFPTTNSVGGICGEIRTAIGLRILCGGSYLDLIGRAYGVNSPSSVYKYFHTFLDWIELTFEWQLVGLLRGLGNDDAEAIDKLHEIAADFAVDSSGYFYGCIGSLDGLAIRIKCPSATKDNVPDPANYFSRKNFYALNVQAICDRRKRILWIDPGHPGASHDSSAWNETKLMELMEELKPKLKEHGFFIVGDSAYPLSVYLQVPYPKAKPSTPEDAFNFWLSNSRIHIECTFGELIMRFGLFWRTLRFDLDVCAKVVRAAAKLHNFLVDCREDTADDDNYFRDLSYSSIKSNSCSGGQSIGNEEVLDINFPLVTDTNAHKPAGWPSKLTKLMEDEGNILRTNLKLSLHSQGMTRTKKNRMRFNRLGHVYFE